MVQFKYRLMSDKAFRFLRATCHLFYDDLSLVKKIPDAPANPGFAATCTSKISVVLSATTGRFILT